MPAVQNALFITIDQLRADCLIGELSGFVNLPNMRTLMDDSVTFTRNFSVANPCGPSRASMLTGQYAMNHRSVRNGTPLRHDAPNIATQMRKAGYLPMLFGYTDTSQDPRAFPANDPALKSYEFPMNGFHEMTEMRLEMSYPWRSHLMKQGYAFQQYWDLYKPVSPSGGAPKLNDPAIYDAKDSDTAFLTDSFLDGMRGYQNESWFAHLTYIRPHPPLVAPAPYNDMYDPKSLPLPKRLNDVAAEMAVHPFLGATDPTAGLSNSVVGFDHVPATEENTQILRSIYLGLATEVDQHIGRVIQFLKDSGQYDHTMIVLTADHGEMLGDRYAWGKMSVFDAAYQTPLIIRMPGAQNAGQQVRAITESIDISPTILNWIGQDAPNSMDGKSLLPFLNGETPADWRDYSFSELDFGGVPTPSDWQKALGTTPSDSCLGILREDRFSLVEFAADLPPLLFDKNGMGELADVSQNPDYAADLARLTRKMLRHRMRNMDHTLSLDAITSNGAVNLPRHSKP
ncbi:MAG: sulfatase-like hydrolase/transferase [Sulfitobacter sp.]